MILTKYPMDELKELFKELNSFENLAKLYLDSKKKANILLNEIESLKGEKKSIDSRTISEKIKRTENELETITRELECSKLLQNVCLSIKELENVFSNIENTEICKDKAMGFLKNLISIFCMENLFVFELFKVEGDCDYYKILRIDNDIENLFSLIKGRSFERDVINEFKSIIKLEVGWTVPYDIDVFGSEKYIYMIFPETENVQANDKLNIKTETKLSFSELLKHYKVLGENILFVLKENLSKAVIKDRYHVMDVIENNYRLENTVFFISNINEWIVDVAMKQMIVFCRERSFDEIIVSNDQLSGKFISKEYYQMTICYCSTS